MEKGSDRQATIQNHAKNKKPFTLAGIYEIKDGKPEFVIITTEPNKLIAPIHNRVPVILTEEDEKVWLGRHPKKAELKILDAYPSQEMIAFPISKQIGYTRIVPTAEMLQPLD